MYIESLRFCFHRLISSYRKYELSLFSLQYDLTTRPYRLTGDIKWPASTPFETAVGASY